MKRIVLCGLLVVLALPVVGGQAAQASPVPAALSEVVGAPTATCTPRGCRYEVTCESPGEAGCIFALTLTDGGLYLTRVPTCILDPDRERGCLPRAKPVYVAPGDTTTLKLKLLGRWRQEVERRLEQGKRTIKDGGWEAIRADLLGPDNEAEAETWDAVPGFFTYPVLGGWLVFQSGEDTKIRLKR